MEIDYDEKRLTNDIKTEHVSTMKIRRRKPIITRKVTVTDSDDADDECDYKKPKTIVLDLDNLPSGTVYIEPESVDETKRKPTQQSKPAHCCTVCGSEIRRITGGYARPHPHLGVLVCKSCYSYYQCVPINRDENGSDDQCLWCGEGGSILCCDNCPRAFCSACIRKNLGKYQLQRIKDPKTKWSCLICDPTPIQFLISECQEVLGQSYTNRPLSKSLLGNYNSKAFMRRLPFQKGAPILNGDTLSVCPDTIPEVLLRTLNILEKLRKHVMDLRKRNRAANREVSEELQNRLKLDSARETEKMLFLFKKAALQCELLAKKRVIEHMHRPKIKQTKIQTPRNTQEIITIESSSGDDCNKVKENFPNSKKTSNHSSSSSFDTSDLLSTDETDRETCKEKLRRVRQKLKKRRQFKESQKLAKSKLNIDESVIEMETNLINSQQDGANDIHDSSENCEFSHMKNKSISEEGKKLQIKNSAMVILKKACITDTEEILLSHKQNINKAIKNESIKNDTIIPIDNDNCKLENHFSDSSNSMSEGKTVNKKNVNNTNGERKQRNKPIQRSYKVISNDEQIKNCKVILTRLNSKLKSKKKDTNFDEEENDENSDCEILEDHSSDEANNSFLKNITSDSSYDDNRYQDDDANKGKKRKGLTKKKKKKKDSSGEDPNKFTDDELDDLRLKRKKQTIKRVISSSSEESGDENSKTKLKKQKMSKDGDEEDDYDDDDDDDDNNKNTPGKRRHIKKIIKDKKLDDDTKNAAKEERERRLRVKERQALYNTVTEEDESEKCAITTKLELDPPNVCVHPKIIRCLKPHQVDAIKFLWECLCESSERVESGDSGSGAILAHCMGLGKTLSVITFLHTVMRISKFNFSSCIIVCPLNTVLNWQTEWNMWQERLEDTSLCLKVYELSALKTTINRITEIENWRKTGGILIVGYEMFRNLVQHKFIKKRKNKDSVTECLINPGADILVADEGHVLKNANTGLSQCISQVKTRRRIVLTGTPLQNNLIEYHCMVDLVKPRLLGTKKEFSNRFVNPITNGQCADSTQRDVKLMKRRAHVLHETLAGCVHRRDYRALIMFLPPKFEYVVYVQLTDIQIKLYTEYLRRKLSLDDTSYRGASLFADYQFLMRIWSHPWQLKMNEIRQDAKRSLIEEQEEDDDFIDDFIDDNSVCSSVESSKSDDNCLIGSESDGELRKSKRKTRLRRKKIVLSDSDKSEKTGYVNKYSTKRTRKLNENNGNAAKIVEPDESKEPDTDVIEIDKQPFSFEWWADYMTEDMKNSVEGSGKLITLCRILALCESIGDKLIVFSQSILTLNFIEHILRLWDEASDTDNEKNTEFLKVIAGGAKSRWDNNFDYFRFDGTTPAHVRKRQASSFNNPENSRARLFLISTKAGGLGINLIGANRVVLLDASWNPSHDVQSIFRVYRFGQKKPCYIYRLLAYGTMEQKIYERQVTKLSLSHRVVDEQQIDRHFNQADLQELYNFKPKPDVEPTPPVPKDRLLAELISELKSHVIDLKEHDSLLEERPEEDLTEEERKAAWEEFEQEKEGVRSALSGLSSGEQMQNMMRGNAQYNQFLMHQRLQQLSAPELFQIQELARQLVAEQPTITQEELQEKLRIRIQQHQYQQYLAQLEYMRMQHNMMNQSPMLNTSEQINPEARFKNLE